MRRNTLRTITAVFIMIVVAVSAKAQNLRSAYFMENATHRHQLNPAFQTHTGYVSVPGLGAFQAEVGTNTFGLESFLYPRDANVVTFLHESVSTAQFLNNIRPNNHLNLNVGISLLSAGFHTKAGFFTVDVSAKTYAGVSVPKDLFAILKEQGLEKSRSPYQINDFNSDASAYGDISVGYSRKLDERFTVGGKLKLLTGFADARLRSNVTAALKKGVWVIDVDGALDAAGVTPKYSEENPEKVEGIDNIAGFGINGMGAGIDLGTTFRSVDLFDGIAGNIFDNLTFSAAVTDLGFISWFSQNTVNCALVGHFEYNESGDKKLDDILFENYTFEAEQSSSYKRMLRTTLNVGAKYSLLDDKIGIGLLSSTRFGAPQNWSELTLSGNFQPLNWLGVCVNYSFLYSHFKTFGWALNFSPSWINFFIGTDYMMTKISRKPNFYPMTNALNVNFGLSVPLAKNTAK